MEGPDGQIRTTWHYDEALCRLKEVQRIASGPNASARTTWRLHPDNAGGLGFEREVSVPDVWSPANPNTQQSRHDVTAMGQVVAVLVTEGALPAPDGDADRTPTEPSAAVDGTSHSGLCGKAGGRSATVSRE